MPAETRLVSAPISRPIVRNAIAIGLFAIVSVQYVIHATTLAARSPFWMDEILAIWTARLPDIPAIWSALARGAEFSPPLYDILLHLLGKIGVASRLGLRLPSIFAIYVAALAIGALVHRRAGVPPAALAAGVVLSTGLFGYAIQARPYALVTAVFALALLVYDRPERASIRRSVTLGLLLALAIALHFYALLLAATVALIEFVRARIERRAPRWRTLAATGVAAISILLWWPILHAAHVYSAADVTAPGYYAQPTMRALVGTYAMLLGWLMGPLIALLIAVVAKGRPARSMLRITALLLTAVPFGIFVFALLVSHSYADRYTLAGGLGIGALFAALAVQLGRGSTRAAMLLLVLLPLGNMRRSAGELGKEDRLEALALVDAAPGTLPIVTGSGLRFLELREHALPAIARRLVFLDVPSGSTDPTNRHQVLRWKAIRPDLNVADVRPFACSTPAFLLFAQPEGGGADDLPRWLGLQRSAILLHGRASLTLVRQRRCTKG